MMRAMSETAMAREKAKRVAAWLVEKERPDEAVALLAAWAANGPNDTEGQELLAEALRIDPGASVAQMAFERMEGMEGEHALLDQQIQAYPAERVSQLEAEMRRPTFRRAQMGFNNNIKFHGVPYHVQTEDSGLDSPHIITHLFADGGRVIKSHKRDYSAEVSRSDVAEFVRGLMKAQHMEMVLMLRDGKFDRIIAGEEVGGISLLTEPPQEVQKIARRKEAAPSGVTHEPPAVAAPEVARHFSLVVLRSLTGGPERYDPVGEEAVIGAAGAINLPGERFCHPTEAILRWRQTENGGALFIEDLEGGNGVFFRISTAVELEIGDEFIVGDQLLRVEKNPAPDDGPEPGPTYFYSSPKWPSSFRIMQVFEGGALGSCVVARGNSMQIGSAVGDLIFADDPLVEEQHCVIEEQASTVVLTDLGSRTGVFVRVRGEQRLPHGSELLVGRTRLVVDLSSAGGQAS